MFNLFYRNFLLFTLILNVMAMLPTDGSMSMCDPFVSLSPEGRTKVHAGFRESIDDISKLVGLSYEIGRDKPHSYADLVQSKGWAYTSFKGKTGLDHDDTPGIVAHHPDKNLVVVSFHGSQSAHDWITNLRVHKADQSFHGLEIPGLLHAGFALKYSQLKSNLYDSLKNTLDGIDPVKRESVQIVTTGHSQGGALAQVALADLATDFGRQYFGSDFHNARDNRFLGWFLSPARVAGDETSWDYITSQVGHQNMVRQGVRHDPVMNINGHKMLDFIGKDKDWAHMLSGYKSLGYIAEQDMWETIARDMKRRLKTSFSTDGFKDSLIKFSTFLYDTYESISEEGWIETMKKGAKGLVNQGMDIIEATSIVSVIKAFLAPVHLGSNRHKEDDMLFDDALIDRNIEAILR